MITGLTSAAWAQIRHDYENTEKPIEAICAEHGISSGTLRDRMRRWRWTRRRAPIPADGPPPTPRLPPVSIWDAGRAPAVEAVPAPDTAATPDWSAAPADDVTSPRATSDAEVCGGSAAIDPGAVVPRLQSAVARVLPAIEATVGTLASGPMPPRAMEQTARALGSLTRTLRELNELLNQRQAAADAAPRDAEALRANLARKLEALVAEQAERRDAERDTDDDDLSFDDLVEPLAEW